VDDYQVILGEFRNLAKFPDLPVASGLAEKQKRLPSAVSFVVNLGAVGAYDGHFALPFFATLRLCL